MQPKIFGISVSKGVESKEAQFFKGKLLILMQNEHLWVKKQVAITYFKSCWKIGRTFLAS